MPSYANPYGPATPIGQGLQNVATALFASRRNAAADPSRSGMYDAHSELYKEQAAKAVVERQLAERLLAQNSDEAVTDVIGSAANMPGRRVRMMRDIENLGGDESQYTPDEWQSYRRGSLAVRPGYADKTVNPVNIAQALDTLHKVGDRNSVIAGRDPTRTAQAHFATSGRAPFDNMGGVGTFNLATGVQSLNDLGNARVGMEESRAGLYDAQAGAAESLAALRDATPPRMPGGAGGGPTTTETVEQIQPLRITPKETQALLGGIRAAVGGQLGDANIEGAVLSRAQAYFRTPGSPAFGQSEAAAAAALKEVLPSGTENPWFGSRRPVGDPVLALPPVPVTGPTTRTKVVTRNAGAAPPATPAPVAPPPAATQRTAVPPPAQRVVNQVYDLPVGPMKWTGRGWVPAGA